jgi:hypothetical protein
VYFETVSQLPVTLPVVKTEQYDLARRLTSIRSDAVPTCFSALKKCELDFAATWNCRTSAGSELEVELEVKVKWKQRRSGGAGEAGPELEVEVEIKADEKLKLNWR